MSASSKSTELDAKVAELAEKYRPLAATILKEAIRIPADYVDKPKSEGGDPDCGLSNHEKPRLDYLKKMIVEIKAVEDKDDVWYDEYGMLVWTVKDKDDGIPDEKKKVIFMDGHTDTVRALRPHWKSRLGEGVDCYNGLLDADKVNEAQLAKELGYTPPKEDWKDYVIFGRGAADQLAGVVSQIISCKIMLELKSLGALKGVIVRSYGTITEEDNDGGGPIFLTKTLFRNAKPQMIPDCVIITEGTGDSRSTALGIYRGQRGRMTIECEVVGKSCHGSMPWEGLNPLEYGARIVAEANDQYEKRETFKDDKFLCFGTRTASWCHLDTPSDCAVPERFVVKFDRRLTVGETPKDAIAAVDQLKATEAARKAGLTVNVRAPIYSQPTWCGYQLNNPQVYPAWVTPEEHPVIKAVVSSYTKCVTPKIKAMANKLRFTETPRVERWIFSTDGVGYVVPSDDKDIVVPKEKQWIDNGVFKHPPMFGIGAGFEQNCHKIGENVDTRELQHAIAVMARFPSMFVEQHQ